MSSKKGFSLTELLVAIAIVSILAGVVLISMSSYRNKANVSKVNTALNSAVASMASCWTFGGKVTKPEDGADICMLGQAYGQWPNFSSINFYYDGSGNNCVFCSSIVGYTPSDKNTVLGHSWKDFFINSVSASLLPMCLDKATGWYFSAKSNTAGIQKVCCNKNMNGCTIIDATKTCDNSIN
jgi:prepilin-type N-terminal cleavage/methylation domain-containing protein